jgi:hypothetical protein
VITSVTSNATTCPTLTGPAEVSTVESNAGRVFHVMLHSCQSQFARWRLPPQSLSANGSSADTVRRRRARVTCPPSTPLTRILRKVSWTGSASTARIGLVTKFRFGWNW